ncbi:MAG: GNAT family acetyltransferase [Gammaproteobacteria bacterium]|nr:GNAT family acetyltransferase [Gammaproteobacteria bacterium]
MDLEIQLLQIIMNKLILNDLKTANKNTLEDVYTLNQDLIPMVGSLNSSSELKNLIDESSNSFYIEKKGKLAAFIVCFREKSEYRSLNYRHFDHKYEKFLYIDRVGVRKTHRNKGIGAYLYEHIFNINEENKLPICAEVNIKPRNEISLRFHEKMGFKETSERTINSNYKVKYVEKNAR